jgi:hypothetical protein
MGRCVLKTDGILVFLIRIVRLVRVSRLCASEFYDLRQRRPFFAFVLAFRPSFSTLVVASLLIRASSALFPMDLQSLFNVSGKVVVVTGGSYGIGLMIATGFITNGCKVYICSRKRDAVESALKELNAIAPGKAFGVAADLGKESGCKELVDFVAKSESKVTLAMLERHGVSEACYFGYRSTFLSITRAATGPHRLRISPTTHSTK